MPSRRFINCISAQSFAPKHGFLHESVLLASEGHCTTFRKVALIADRPHTALGYLAPSEFARIGQNTETENDPKLAQRLVQKLGELPDPAQRTLPLVLLQVYARTMADRGGSVPVCAGWVMTFRRPTLASLNHCEVQQVDV